jgi:hypothetical protein
MRDVTIVIAYLVAAPFFVLLLQALQNDWNRHGRMLVQRFNNLHATFAVIDFAHDALVHCFGKSVAQTVWQLPRSLLIRRHAEHFAMQHFETRQDRLVGFNVQIEFVALFFAAEQCIFVLILLMRDETAVLACPRRVTHPRVIERLIAKWVAARAYGLLVLRRCEEQRYINLTSGGSMR